MVDPGLCEFCKELKEVAYADPLGRQYCMDCFSEASPVVTPMRMLSYLLLTVPFRIGDRVECRTAGVLFDGVGVVDDVSFDLEHFATPVYPSFHVVITDKAYKEAPDDLWYCEKQLIKVDI